MTLQLTNSLLFVDGLLNATLVRDVASDVRGIVVGNLPTPVHLPSPYQKVLSIKREQGREKDPLLEANYIYLSRQDSGKFHPIISDWCELHLCKPLPPLSKAGTVYKLHPKLFDCLMFFRGYYEALEDYSSRGSLLCQVGSLREQLKPLTELVIRNDISHKDLIDIFKYWCVYPMWKLISRDGSCRPHNPPPKHPGFGISGWPFTGKLRRYLRNITCSSSSSAFRMCWTLFQGVKRASAVVPEAFFQGALLDHALALTKEPLPLGSEKNENIRLLGGWVAQKIGLRLDIREKQVSSSASYATPRKFGGSLGELIRQVDDPGLIIYEDNLGRPVIKSDDLSTGLPFRKVIQTLPLHRRGPLPNYGIGEFDLDFRQGVLDNKESFMNVIPLAEPLKVRVITTASAAVTHIGRLFQAPLRQGMFEKTNIFLPTGRPLIQSDIQNVATRGCDFFQHRIWKVGTAHPRHTTNPLDPYFDLKLSHENFVVVSGDYKAATDGLNINVTLSLYDGISKYLTVFDKRFDYHLDQIFRQNLRDIKLVYPKSTLTQPLTRVVKLFVDCANHFDIHPLQFSITHPFFKDGTDDLARCMTENGYTQLTKQEKEIFNLMMVTTDQSKNWSYTNVSEATMLQNELDSSEGVQFPLTLTMKTGQLMGSIMSFPLLCLANMFSYCDALYNWLVTFYGLSSEDDLKSDYLTEIFDLVWTYSPLYINGDDILFRCPLEFVSFWRDSAASLGFTLSPGKNYVHPRLCTINSTLYHLTNLPITRPQVFSDLARQSVDPPVHDVTDPGVMTGLSAQELKYFNLGLLLPYDVRVDKPAISLKDQYNDMIVGALNPLRANRRFIHYHSREIRKVTQNGRFQLYLPCELFGLGFKPNPAVIKSDLTLTQQLWASNMFHRYQRVFGSRSVIRGKKDLDHYLPKVRYVTVGESEYDDYNKLGSKGLTTVQVVPPEAIGITHSLFEKAPVLANIHMVDSETTIHCRYPERSILQRLARRNKNGQIFHKSLNGKLIQPRTLQDFNLVLGVPFPAKKLALDLSIELDHALEVKKLLDHGKQSSAKPPLPFDYESNIPIGHPKPIEFGDTSTKFTSTWEDIKSRYPLFPLRVDSELDFYRSIQN